MKRIAINLLGLALVGTVFADAASDTIKAPSRAEYEQMKRVQDRIMKRTGGRLMKPGSQKGAVALVNTQKKIASKDLFAALVKEVDKDYNIKTVILDDAKPVTVETAEKRVLEANANLAVFVVEAQGIPPLLVAPEARWAMVNVFALEKGGGSAELLAERTKREVYRAFAIVCGGFLSQFPNNIMEASSIQELDKKREAFLPVDFQQRLGEYLPKVGVQPAKYEFYVKACREGWAPQPTNAYQKAIWDQVHELPSNPIKIKYDPKKGK